MKTFSSTLIHTFKWTGNLLQSFCEPIAVTDGDTDSILLWLWGLESETLETVSFELSSVCCLCFGTWATTGLEWSLGCKEDPESTEFQQQPCCLLSVTVLGLATVMDSLLSFTLFSSSLESSSKIILDNFFFECSLCLIFICFSFTARRVLYFLLPLAKQSSVIKLKSTRTSSSLDWLLQDSSSWTQKLSSK